MAYLLDTDVLIYHIKGTSTANQLVDRLIESSLSISAITYMEVSDGLYASGAALAEEPRFIRFITQASVLGFDQGEAHIAAELRRDLRQRGRSVRARALDIMIAATAISHDLTLVTNNPTDYQGLADLQLEPANIHL